MSSAYSGHAAVSLTALSRPVREYMSAPVHTISIDAELKEAGRRIESLSITSLAVVDSRRHLCGVLSLTDLLAVGRFRADEQGKNAFLLLPHQGIEEVMHRDVLQVGPDAPVREAARIIVENGVHRVFVTLGGEILGVLSTRDIMLAVRDARLGQPISDFMSAPVITVQAEESLSLATDRLAAAHIRGLVVLENAWPVGLFTQREALASRDLPASMPVEVAMSCALLCLPLSMPLHRAAAHAAATRARRVIAVEDRMVRGVLTGIDLARAATDEMGAS